MNFKKDFSEGREKMENDYARFYGNFSEGIDNTLKTILDKLNTIVDSLKSEDHETPAEHILSRIKSPESLCKKLLKRGFEQNAETGVKQLSDIIGVRVVTHFVGDVYAVAEKIVKEKSWEIVKQKDYIADPKPNGYRSLHIIIKLPCSPVRAEIQLRTIAMDCWASLEHSMKYKKNIGCKTELIVSELKRCADEIASTDLSMQTLRELIRRNNKEAL